MYIVITRKYAEIWTKFTSHGDINEKYIYNAYTD